MLSNPTERRCRWPSIALLAIAAVGCASWSGCASWTDRPESELGDRLGRAAFGVGRGGEGSRAGGSKLVSLGESPSAVSLAVEFLSVPLSSETSVWQSIDETAIPLAVRKRYQANGLRVGRVIREDRFRRAIEQRSGGADVLDDFLREASVASPLAQGERNLPMRFGRRYELPLHQPRGGEEVSLLRVDRELIGRTLRSPQLLLALSVRQGNSPREVSLEIRPEIQHGEAKQSFISSETAIRIDTRREVWRLESLDFSATLAAGEAVVLSTTDPPIGIGEQLLTDAAAGGGREQLFLVLRLASVPSLADQL